MKAKINSIIQWIKYQINPLSADCKQDHKKIID